MIKYKLLLDFTSPDAEKRWEVMNDAVMGGLSEGRLIMTTGNTGLFEGNVSLDNNGGFSAIRTRIGDLFLDMFFGLAVRVKGDGKRYRLRVRSDDAPEGFAYQAQFDTQPDNWLTVHIPFKEFEAFFRGEGVPHAPALQPGDIRIVGLMIADKQAGPFRLEIEWIKAYLAY